MCDNNQGPKLQLVFDELYRKTVPCVRINNESLIKVLKLAQDHCLALDGCCSSRVKVSLCDFERILTDPCNEDEQAISAYFQCPQSARGCCDCAETDGNDDNHGDDKDKEKDTDKNKDKDKEKDTDKNKDKDQEKDEDKNKDKDKDKENNKNEGE